MMFRNNPVTDFFQIFLLPNPTKKWYSFFCLKHCNPSNFQSPFQYLSAFHRLSRGPCVPQFQHMYGSASLLSWTVSENHPEAML